MVSRTETKVEIRVETGVDRASDPSGRRGAGLGGLSGARFWAQPLIGKRLTEL